MSGRMEQSEELVGNGLAYPGGGGCYGHSLVKGEGWNHRCVVCERKHNRYAKHCPGVTESTNPFKRRKTSYRCSSCQVYLCAKRYSPCWTEWHKHLET
ncbi:hypothetical protein ACOMHN_007473 [Nucella lapillus]